MSRSRVRDGKARKFGAFRMQVVEGPNYARAF